MCELATRICLKQQDYENAIRYGEMALAHKPGYFYAHEKLAFAYSFAKQDEAAAKQFELALKSMPADQPDFKANRARLNFQLGMTRSRQEKYDLAIVQFDESLKLNPKQPLLLNLFALLLLECPDASLRNPARALDLAQQACALTQLKNPAFLKTLALAYIGLNNPGPALQITRNALALATASGDAVLAAELQQQLVMLTGQTPDSR
jgi:tetratricopeptide (TPR) repeat protein